MISAVALIAIGCAPLQATVFSEPLTVAADRFGLRSRQEIAGLIAQAMHESAKFTRMEEGLSYSDPERIARIFRSAFDLDHDKQVDPEEIEFARAYVRQPEKLANRAYANRNGNGDEASGDGWRFRGSGPFQLTGRANFMAFSAAVGIDYVANPDAVRREALAGCLSAAWFWVSTGCNDLVSVSFDATTKRINGPAMLGAAERRAYYAKALQELP